MKHAFKKFSLIVIAVSCLSLAGCATYSSRQYHKGEVAFHQQDYHTAFKDLIYSAGYNNTDAQYAVGYMYYYGIGTQQNDYLARLWLYRSASFGNAKAMSALQAMDRSGHNPGLMEQTSIHTASPLKQTHEYKKRLPKPHKSPVALIAPRSTLPHIPAPHNTGPQAT